MDTTPSVIVLGAGAAGICMGIALKKAGLEDFVILEKSPRVGGTWHDNRYPGAACDVVSHLYCYSFEPNPDWSHRFAPQPEIERYFARCVDRYGLAPHLRLGVEVASARFDEAAGLWCVRTVAGQELRARVLVSATGQLNRPHVPALPGLGEFAGATFHSARWDATHALAGRRVAVVGNGASAVQFVPQIAPRVRALTLFQRSANYVLPREDRAYHALERWAFRHAPLALRAYRAGIFAALEARFLVFDRDGWPSRLFRSVALQHMRSVVADPALRAKLTPDYPPGCKRVLIADDYYPALVRPNVAVETSPIARVTRDAVVTRDGVAHPADTIIFATGFEATSFLAPMRVEGRGGAVLADAWRDGAEAHLGVVVAGFPNLFVLYGPNTNLGHNSILFMIECQVRYALGCIRALGARDARWLDVRRDAMARSNARLQRDLAGTAWAAGCSSWYKTATGKITNNWSGFCTEYWWRTRAPDLGEFEFAPTARV